MKKMWIVAAALLAGLSLSAANADVNGAFAKIGKNNIPENWYLNGWDGYKPLPKVSVTKDGAAVALQFTEVKGKSGFGFACNKYIPCKAGNVITVTARVKGKGSVWFGLQTFSAKDWTGCQNNNKSFTLTSDWKEVKCEIPVENIKGKAPTAKVMFTFGLNKKNDELTISNLKCDIK